MKALRNAPMVGRITFDRTAHTRLNCERPDTRPCIAGPAAPAFGTLDVFVRHDGSGRTFGQGQSCGLEECE